MYDRAPRNFSWMVAGTPSGVGPGSYNSRLLAKCEPASYVGYAPFLSLSSRKWLLDGAEGLPGPGEYNPMIPLTRTKNITSLISRSNRFQCDKTSEVPGPGAYDITEGLTSCAVKPATLHKDSVCEDTNLTNHLRYQRHPTVPSIPSTGQAYGYEETGDGYLKQQKPPNVDVSLGPAYYTPVAEDALSTKQYRGIHWGRMKSKRSLFEPKEGPAPGDYNPFKEPLQQPAKDQAMIFQELIDSNPEQDKKVTKEPAPGPGHYNITREFDRRSCGELCNCVNVKMRPPFLVQSKRFKELKSDTPAPGTYNDPRGCLENLHKIRSLKMAPFGQISGRFSRSQDGETPGPNVYRIPGALDKVRFQRCYSDIHGAFNSTDERRVSLAGKEAYDLPGPAHYMVDKVPARVKTTRLTSSFASFKPRLAPDDEKENPPPGSYEVVRSFDRTQRKIAPRPPRTSQARRNQGSFSSSTCRFNLPHDMSVFEADPDAPGPGTYDYTSQNNLGNTITAKDKRFRNYNNDNFPAPNVYEYSPLIQDSVLKGTFNVTLSNGYQRSSSVSNRQSSSLSLM